MPTTSSCTPNSSITYLAKYSTQVQRALLGELVQGEFNFFWSENGPSCPLRLEGKEDIHTRSIIRLRFRVRGGWSSLPLSASPVSENIHVYVCMHMERSQENTGTWMLRFQACVSSLQSRHMWVDTGVRQMCSCIPHGEWLGLVEREDVPDILDTILSLPAHPVKLDETPLSLSSERFHGPGMSKEA